MIRPSFDLVGDLHRMGRQLAVLKQMYQSYTSIIDRILEKQKPNDHPAVRRPGSRDHGQSSGTLLATEATTDSQRFDDPVAPPTHGVRLSEAAVVRFERLRDRINLYALGEIEDCLAEKESLDFMVWEGYGKESWANRHHRTSILLHSMNRERLSD